MGIFGKKKEDIKEKEKELDNVRISGMDINTLVDLVGAIMNQAEVEEHLMFQWMKEKKDVHLKLLKEVRNKRKRLLGLVIGHPSFDTACLAKHYLIITDRLIEVAEKLACEDNIEEAKKMLEDAKYFYELFWTIALKKI